MSYRNLYSPEIAFSKAATALLREGIIEPRLGAFFQARDIRDSHEIKASRCVSDLDFTDYQHVTIKYFYKQLLSSLKKEDGGFGPIYYTITYDKQLTPLRCEKTGLLYNQLYLGEKPILYYIYFDLQELFDFIRSSVKAK